MEHIISTTGDDPFAGADDADMTSPIFETKDTGCPGSRFAQLQHEEPAGCPGSRFADMRGEAVQTEPKASQAPGRLASRLNQWPCQIKLLPAKTPFYNGAKLLIAADCTAYAYANMHEDFMKDRVTLIGCPKLDDVDYTEKLTQIISENDIKSVTVVRMEVPCCGGLQMAAQNALKASGKFLPWRVVTISTDGKIIDD